MNHAQRKAQLLEVIKTLAADVASNADAISPNDQSVQRVLDGIERLHRLGFSLNTEVRCNAIAQEMKAREAQQS